MIMLSKLTEVEAHIHDADQIPSTDSELFKESSSAQPSESVGSPLLLLLLLLLLLFVVVVVRCSRCRRYCRRHGFYYNTFVML